MLLPLQLSPPQLPPLQLPPQQRSPQPPQQLQVTSKSKYRYNVYSSGYVEYPDIVLSDLNMDPRSICPFNLDFEAEVYQS
jgi:hypothetical protein